MVVRKIKEENTMKEKNNWGLEQEGAVVKSASPMMRTNSLILRSDG